MVKRCIMIFPEFENGSIIDEIRSKYDPLANHVRPHITLVFPFDSVLTTDELREHVSRALDDVKPFHIQLKGITPSKSFGCYLFLNVVEGKEKIAEVHHRLYIGILEKYLPVWLRNGNYYPHMTVGKFADEGCFVKAAEEVGGIDCVFDTIVNKISVEIIDENEDSIIEFECGLQ